MYLNVNFSHVEFSDRFKPLRIGPYKILDRVSDVTYELLSQDGSTLHVLLEHLIPYYPKEPFVYPHLRHFMRYSDSNNYKIPKLTEYANSDSYRFNSDDSLSDENSSQDNLTLNTPSNYNTDFLSQHLSVTKQTIKTPQQHPPIDRSRHQSQNQSIVPSPNIERTIKSL